MTEMFLAHSLSVLPTWTIQGSNGPFLLNASHRTLNHFLKKDDSSIAFYALPKEIIVYMAISLPSH